jgi:hypothetical protein
MFIKLVDIEVSDLGSATSFFADVLEAPFDESMTGLT